MQTLLNVMMDDLFETDIRQKQINTSIDNHLIPVAYEGRSKSLRDK